MKRIRIDFEFDGSEFCGSQSQINGIAIQDTLQKALSEALAENVKLTISGRTDAGVSAMHQVAHFDTDSIVPPDKICLLIKPLLPSSIVVFSSQLASDNFHAISSAKCKTYVYKMYLSDFASPLRRRTHTRVDKNINIALMVEQSQKLIGEHDFISFMASGSNVKTTVRTISDCKFIHQGDELHFYITANGFLYNMVRIIIGTLIDIGKGKSLDIGDIIAARDRTAAGRTAPPEGLCLVGVEY